MKRYIVAGLALCCLLGGCTRTADVAGGDDFSEVCSDYWAAADALGRTLPEAEEAGAPREDKLVAMFYWTWHTDALASEERVVNITEVLREHPEAIRDYDHPAWGKPYQPCFWEQPLFGYYRTTDPWVLRKHAEMLADAGVDVVFFDCTNDTLTWKSSYEVLLATWDQARKQGVKVPKFAFMLPFGPIDPSRVSLRRLYNDIYKANRYPDLWFVWKGKPCIMAYPDNLTDSEEDRAIAEFFTFRPGQPDLVDGPQREDQWGWLENYPQHGYIPDSLGRFEMMPVGIAQNANAASGGHCCAFNAPETFSRSYSARNGFDTREEGYLYGWNFQEQWDRARETDPQLVFVTGWNEFIASKHENWHPARPHKPFAFPDQFDWDRSRDIEPNAGWGDRGDVYYYQLVDNVRRFKGMKRRPETSGPKSFRIGRFRGWDGVEPDYRHYRGNTMHRDHPGHGGTYYVNTTGRNDIVDAKVARDDENLYFYVETDRDLTPSSDRNWMMLLIDMDRDKSTGWEGYDFLLNYKSPAEGKGTVSRCVSDRWEWTDAGGFEYAVEGNRMELKIPRSLLGVSGKDLDFEFKWSDNMQDEGNVMDFYVNGDVAPGGRFNFVYTAR